MNYIFLICSLFTFPVLAMNNNNDDGVPMFREIDEVAESNQELCIKEYSIGGFFVPFYTQKHAIKCQEDAWRRYESFAIINMVHSCLGKDIEVRFDFIQPKRDHNKYANDLLQNSQNSKPEDVITCVNKKYEIFDQRINYINDRNKRYQ